MRTKAKVHAKWHRREQRLKAAKQASAKPTVKPEPVVAEPPLPAAETPQPTPEA